MSLRMSSVGVGLAVLAAACSSTTEPGPAEPTLDAAVGGPGTVTPTGIINSTLTQPGTSQRFRMEYHLGPVMANTSAVYLIWYGNWSGNTATAILPDLATTLGSSNYFNVVTRYPDINGSAPNGALIYAGGIVLGYEYGTSLTRQDVHTLVADLILNNRVFRDAQGVYVVLASADVHIEGFGTSWCGYHDRTRMFGADNLKYAVLVNPDRALPHLCKPQAGGPNGNPGADAMASHLAALLASTLTSPSLDTWYDRNGLEVGQKCAWTFGTTYTAPNGSLANVKLGQRDFLLQQLWWPTRKGGVCALAAP